LTLENGTNRLFQNIVRNYHSTLCKTPKDHKSHILIAFPKIKNANVKKFCLVKDLFSCENHELAVEINLYLTIKYFLQLICDIRSKNYHTLLNLSLFLKSVNKEYLLIGRIVGLLLQAFKEP